MITIDLSGRTALITGAGQGLGAAATTALHHAGANVAVNYFADAHGGNQRRADELVASLGRRALAVQADVRNTAQCDAMTASVIEHFGSLDIVINNAGILRDRTMKNLTDEDWQAVIDTNLTGVFHVCRAAAARMSDGGRIVNISSIAAQLGFFGQSNYSAAKAGVIALTKVLSRELAKRRINVNAVAPGVVLTDMGKSIPEQARTEMLKSIPMGRFAEPHEIADVILFLCSDLSSYMTGQTLHVNGGWWG